MCPLQSIKIKEYKWVSVNINKNLLLPTRLLPSSGQSMNTQVSLLRTPFGEDFYMALCIVTVYSKYIYGTNNNLCLKPEYISPDFVMNIVMTKTQGIV